MAAMTLQQRIVVSPMPLKALCLILVFIVSFTAANDAIVGAQDASHIDHEQQLHGQSVPNGENSRSKQSSFSDNPLLPWYMDFLKLPSDGMLAFLRVRVKFEFVYSIAFILNAY
jgi:hypothetical protein